MNRIFAIISLQIFILIPTTLYVGNIDQFNMPLQQLLRLAAIPGLFIWLVFAVTTRIFKSQTQQRITVVLAAVSIIMWFQANVLLWDYGLLDGRNIDWSIARWRGYVDAAIWLIGIAVAIVFHRKIKTQIIKVAVAVFTLQVLTVSYAIIDNLQSLREKSPINTKNAQNELAGFSKTANIFHILLDGFQSDVFLDLVNDKDRGEQYRKAFNGFVFYKETLSAFPYTRFAVPALLSGKMYDNQSVKDDFLDEVLGGKTILNTAEENGFEVDLAIGDAYFAKRYAHTRYKNFFEISPTDNFSETLQLLDLSLFRIAPHFIKSYIYNNQKWFLRNLLPGNNTIGTYVSHTRFLYQFIEKMKVSRDKPVYKYIHVLTTHNPMVVNKDCSYAGGMIPTIRYNLTVQSACTLNTLAKIFNKMKSLGIYNKSMIVVHADHGGWVPNHRRGPEVHFKNGTLAQSYVASLASPLLMIKRPGAKQDFQISSLLTSLLDIPDTVSDIMNWHVNFGHTSILKLKPGEERTRHYRFYFWQRDAWETDHTGPIQEFDITGSHFENPWIPGRVFLPPQ